MAMNMFKRAMATAVSNAAEVVGLKSGGAHDEVLDGYKSRLSSIQGEMSSLKNTAQTYSKAMLALGASGCSVCEDFKTVYAKSAPRQPQINTFVTAEQAIDETTFKVFRDSYGWDILKVLDDWQEDSNRLMDDIRNTEAALEQVKTLEAKVASYRAAKDKKSQRGQDTTSKDAETLQQAEEMLTKYQTNFNGQRAELDKKINAFFDGRYALLDSVFVRFIELQTEFSAQMSSSLKPLQDTVTNYRKRYPLDGSKRTSNSPSPAPSASGRNSISPGPKAAPPAANTAAAASPIPDFLGGASILDAKPAASEDEEEESEEETDDSEDDEDHHPIPAASKSPRNASPAAFATSPRGSVKSPVPAPDTDLLFGSDKPQSNGELFDLFGSAPSKPAPTSSSPKHASPSPDPAFDLFDFSGPPTSAATSPKPAAAAKTTKSKPAPAANIDPFASLEDNSIKSPTARSAKNSRQNSMANLNNVTTAVLEDHIENAQVSRIQEIREQEIAEEAEAEAKRLAGHKLEDRLNQWSTKDGQRKHIRTLLSSLHTILWPNSGWKTVSVADLLDASAIKKSHRRAILVLHPDKLQNATSEQKVIAEHAFDALNQAMERYQEIGQ
jgi:hypothetical protein